MSLPKIAKPVGLSWVIFALVGVITGFL